MALPPAAELIELVKTSGPAALDAYGPEVDALATIGDLTAYLGKRPGTISTARGRGHWPEPEPLPGRSPLWTYRKVIVYLAERPGPGNRTNHPRKGSPE